MPNLILEQPIDAHLKPVKDVDLVNSAMEISTTKVRVQDLEVTGSTLGISASDDTKLPLAGGTMTGNVDFGDNDITNVDSLDTDKLSIVGGTEMTAINDQDDMSGDSATALATQQSIKAYCDAVPLSGAYNKTIIKVMPTEFRVNDDYARTPNMVEDDTADTLGIRMGSTTEEAYAFVKIPDGYTVTLIRVSASASTSSAVEAYSFNYNSGAIVSKGSGDFNASIDITDIDSGVTSDLVIKIIPASNSTIIYGALVTIAST